MCKQCKNSDALAQSQRPDVKQKRQEEYKANHARIRDGQLQRIFGITLDSYNSILAEQDGRCAICGGPPDGKALAVDHDHSTGYIRGLLCRGCNTGLGCFRDSAEFLTLASRYLERHK